MTVLQTEPDHDRHLMTIALTARLDSGSGVKPLTPARFWKACAALGGDLADAAASGSEDLQSLAQRTTAAALHASELEGQGLALLTPFHEHYPAVFRDRLGSNAPPLLVSAVHPDAGFSVGNAMARNKLIYALSTVTYVAAVVEGQGGTWNGAVEALRHGYGRVAVNAEAQAAAALQAQGAEVVNSVHALCSQVEAPPPPPAVSDEAPSSEGLQVTLFD
jgi:predicted Rossmann fold nucleotide-binding protein DprA/Smf involved in DNA uptake